MAPSDIKRHRRRLGLSQVELAQRLGVHPLTVSRWERGAVPMPKAAGELLKLWSQQTPPLEGN